MKYVIYLSSIGFFLLTQSMLAQNRLVAPTFVDSNQFKRNLLQKVDLKFILRQLKRDTIIGYYKFFFRIKSDGSIEPYRYFDSDDNDMAKLQYFVRSVFNNYKWNPGYKFGCTQCKIKSYLELIVSFEPDQNRITTLINQIAYRYNKTLFCFQVLP